MYYDLIYTRCRRGIDILRCGQPVLSDGFKVYACSSDLYKGNLIDLPLAVNSIQKKQSFAEPDFMEDAYLYAVPDIGLKLLNCFHPVPYDLSVTGDFAKRPGMYLNHTVAGDFDDIYPFETFHDESVWTAQKNNEAYYYEQEPSELPPRKLSAKGAGRSGFSEVGEFIGDGRKEALKKAVSFILSQFACPPEERKYLVIKEESPENIEMWIAAIELAFSPRIASKISFATRMDKYVSSNLYYVSEDGTFSQLQQSSAGNHARLRAMIIGVAAKDKANGVRRLEGAPYLVLDGEKKEALFDGDISGEYFELISSFDETHERFSREFLQSVDLREPCEKLKALAEAFRTLYGDSSGTAEEWADALGKLSSCRLYKTRIIGELYQRANERAKQFVGSSVAKALPIFGWIGKSSAFMGDVTAKERISGIISDKAEEVFFTAYEKGGFGDLWDSVKGGPFEKNIAGLLSDDERMEERREKIRSYEAEDAVKFVEIYGALCGDRLKAGDERAKMFVSDCVSACAGQKAMDLIEEIAWILAKVWGKPAYSWLFDCIRVYEPELLKPAADHMAGNKAENRGLEETLTLCEALYNCGMDDLQMTVIRRFIEKVDLRNLDVLARKAGKSEGFSDHAKRILYELLDGRVDAANPDFEGLAVSIQSGRPGNAVCPQSAHLAAIGRLRNMKKGDSAAKCLKSYVKQGFPSILKSRYVTRLASVILERHMDQDSQDYILQMFMAAPEIYGKTYMSLLVEDAESCPEQWNCTVAFLAKCPEGEKTERLKKALGDALAESGMKKRDMDALGRQLNDKAVRKYYTVIADDAADKAKEKEGSFMSRLFGGFGK